MCFKVGVSSVPEDILKTHRQNYCIVKDNIMIREMGTQESSFVEMCGILFLKNLASAGSIFECLNNNNGYDNWQILTAKTSQDNGV